MRLAPLVFLALLSFHSPAKTVKLFQEYDFSQGGYALVGTITESDRSGLRDSLGEFFTDDPALLEEFKSTWVFTKESPRYACGYHYKIKLVRGGEELAGFRINLNCNEIVTDNYEAYFFDAQLLRCFLGRLKRRPVECAAVFLSLEAGRAGVDSICRNDSALLYMPQPKWLKTDGLFGIEVIDSAGRFERGGWGIEEKSMTAYFQKAYPGEFVFVEMTGSYGPPGVPAEYTLTVYGRRSLYEKMRARYKVVLDWQALHPEIYYLRKAPCAKKR